MVAGTFNEAKPGLSTWTLLWQNKLMSWNLFRHRHTVYCAFCSSERKVNRKRSLGLADVMLTLVASFVIMYLIFRDTDARVFLIFIFSLAVTEFFIQIRWRLGVVCPHCGFDPVLYSSSPEKAAAKVKAHLVLRHENPNNLLARPLNLPTRKATSEERAARVLAKSAMEQNPPPPN